MVGTAPAMPMSALAGGFGRCTLNNGHPNVLVPVSNQGMEIASMGFLKTTRAGVVRKHTTLSTVSYTHLTLPTLLLV